MTAEDIIMFKNLAGDAFIHMPSQALDCYISGFHELSVTWKLDKTELCDFVAKLYIMAEDVTDELQAQAFWNGIATLNRTFKFNKTELLQFMDIATIPGICAEGPSAEKFWLAISTLKSMCKMDNTEMCLFISNTITKSWPIRYDAQPDCFEGWIADDHCYSWHMIISNTVDLWNGISKGKWWGPLICEMGL